MQRRRLLAVLGTLVAMPSFAIPRNITRVIVRDEAFEVVREMSSTTELAKFAEHWSMGTQTADSAIQFTHKIDISYGDRGERWLYSAAGFARALTKKKTSTYRLANPQSFNVLLGIA